MALTPFPCVSDRQHSNLGRYSACRRVARTIFMGSAPLRQAANIRNTNHALCLVRSILGKVS